MKPSPPPGDLPDPVVKLMSLMYPALAGGFFTTRSHLGSPICWLEIQKDEMKLALDESSHEYNTETSAP